MHDTPPILQEICLDSLCDAVWTLMTGEQAVATSLSKSSSHHQPTTSSSFTADGLPPVENMELGDDADQQKQEQQQRMTTIHESTIPCIVSDDLLSRMSERRQLTDATIRYFDSNRTNLKHVRVTASSRDSNTLSGGGLRILSEHRRLETLSLRKFRDTLDFGDVVETCLNSEARSNLSLLDVRGTFGYSLVERSPCFGYFTNLRALVVADTPFDDACLMRICKDMPRLESLDISHTKVKDIGPLLLTRDRLRVLLMHRPRFRSTNDALDVLVGLHRLETIDISDKAPGPDQACDQQRGRLGVSLVQRASREKVWRELKILDMSGDQANFDTNDFSSFLSNHSTLEFLGLLMTNACYFDCLSSGSVKVAGDASKSQIMTALETYVSPDYFCSRSMYLLFGILQQNDDETVLNYEERTMCIEHVVRGLRANFDSLSVCMAGTACLYNLCRGNGATGVRPSLLRQIVESSLMAIERHAKTPQLHKNVWLTLCNDHLLQSGAFDMYRCCTAALDSMVRNGDNSITRMTMAIISILAAKIPTEMTTKLGTNRSYMQFLLRVVEQKTESQTQWYIVNGVDIDQLPQQQQDDGQPNAPPQPDVTLKFALSALWNLTDESPPTCRCLLEEGGLGIVIGVLAVFHDHSIETKVLGLLNNVSEVEDLRCRLLSQSSLTSILRLLKSTKIDVSYFAAGILAHLCADQNWNIPAPTRDDCLSALEDSISAWTPAETEMVAYRSFKPFFSLLAKDDMPAVQLWAVWAIRHVCSKNVARYVDMFKNEGGKRALEKLLASSTSNNCASPYARRLIYDVSKDILDLLVQ